jgi:integrase
MKLTTRGIDSWVRAATKGAKLSDGNGLYLVKGADGARWAFLYTSPVTGKRREAGLGAIDVVGLAAARSKASTMRDVLATGGDPLEARRIERAQGVTFKQCADDTREVIKGAWRHDDTAKRWDDAIAKCRVLHSTPVRTITPADIASVLRKVEATTVRRHVQLCVRRVFDTALAQGLCASNPADGRVVGRLVSLTHRKGHQPALHWRDVPAFVRTLRERDTPAARCLEFIIRTGMRKLEAAALTWDEVDIPNAVLHLSEDRTKQGRTHDVPLTPEALRIVLEQQLRHPNSRYVFPGSKGADHLSHGAFLHLTPGGVSVHGFRSSLRSFLGDCTTVSYETAEGVLGHLVGDATVRAYRRSTDLERRREALNLWGAHIDGVFETVKQTSNVVKFQPLSAGAQ